MPNFAELQQQRPRTPSPDYDEPAPDYEKQIYLFALELQSASAFVGDAMKRLLNGESPPTVLLPTEQHVAQFKSKLARVQKDWSSSSWIDKNDISKWQADVLSAAILDLKEDTIPVRAYEGTGILGQLRPDNSRLYVTGHGLPGNSTLNYNVHGSWINRTMKDVPGELLKHGLRRDFRDVRLLACHSGERGPGGCPSMAEQLRDHMQDAGFGKVDVSGYLGAARVYPEVDPHGGRVRSMMRDTANQKHRRSELRVRFPVDPNSGRR